MEWAIKNNVETKSAHKTIELGKSLSFNLQKIELNDFRALASRRINRLSNTVDGWENNLATEHIGYLHLERMGFTPAGIERGRLVHSVPLSPGEEVNIRQREWSRTSEEFERIVTDYLEEFSEEGVTEKTELAQSVDSQKQHSTAFNTAVSASGEAWGFSIHASVGYNASESASKSEQITRNHTRELTSKASSRSKQEHKISFRVASARETEDETVQRIKNPFSDRATRVDYYQLMRKWQVDLYRYGIRLTYDIAIPEPGSGILSKIVEINEIRNEVAQEFEFPYTLSDITPDELWTIAEEFGADVEDPPSENPEPVTNYAIHNWTNPDESRQESLYALKMIVDNKYIVSRALVHIGYMPFEDTPMEPSDVSVLDGWVADQPDDAGFQSHIPKLEEKSGELAVIYRARNVRECKIRAEFRLTLKPEALEAWQYNAWKAILEAAQTQYYERRLMLKEKLSRLEEEFGAQDALSLRKKEREEVMKGVLRYLICPDVFEFFPDGIFQPGAECKDFDEVLYDSQTGLINDDNNRISLLNYGETIKFLHHAIEWENMLYFLYPYFWTHPTRWEFKKYLDHPDPMHRAFLKAGSARVVLTIRPGFENAFLAFIDTGDMNDLPPSPYLEIGQEFRNYANTNYPGIPPANPVENFRPLLTHKQKNAWRIMQLHIRLLELFYRTNRRYPSTNEGLSAIRQVFPIKDPWGNDYVYKCPGQHDGPYDLASYGADGAPGGSGENADIANWDDSPMNRKTPKQVQAWDDIQLISLLLEEYYKVHGSYPSTEEGLQKLKELIPLKDPWDRDYVYTCPGVHADYELVCYGANGVPGGEGEDADITSWAEASLIGQWFEYTPTSALDIAFDNDLVVQNSLLLLFRGRQILWCQSIDKFFVGFTYYKHVEFFSASRAPSFYAQ
jgi:type II secretory pathway pseudopilin PulG